MKKDDISILSVFVGPLVLCLYKMGLQSHHPKTQMGMNPPAAHSHVVGRIRLPGVTGRSAPVTLGLLVSGSLHRVPLNTAADFHSKSKPEQEKTKKMT